MRLAIKRNGSVVRFPTIHRVPRLDVNRDDSRRVRWPVNDVVLGTGLNVVGDVLGFRAVGNGKGNDSKDQDSEQLFHTNLHRKGCRFL